MSDELFDKLFSHLQQQQQTKNTNVEKNDGFQDVSMSKMINHQIVQQQYNKPTTRVCTLKPGSVFYRPLNSNGWPTKFPLVREGGVTATNSQEFEYRGEKKVYKVDKNDTLDFSKMDENSQNVIVLVEVKSNFVGTILVPPSAITEVSTTGNNTKKILMG